ncbi:testosterone 17-beta-dehydrogenase 3 [Podarcis lilfordi]|uniref:Testosterone 17-beta-dehydrogenase 3 n=1 Tax=Podarcis lilfordi TaxID=74358 RepID=A0AA35PIR4_9SAUR|nr:testosterone 17-beta-dehydrogenase 3 [Podarcis lilfordi]
MGEFLQQFLACLGGFTCLVFLVKCVRLLKYFSPLVWRTVPESFFRSMGEWAVITGSGDGIGKAYSFELARRGLNIVLISRTLTKMQKVASEIEQSTGRKVKIIQADFTRRNVYNDIEDGLQGLEIGILVNNVGMLSSPSPTRFLNGPENDGDLINCNIFSVTKMTRMILKQMVSRQKGLILNVSSAVGTFVCPLYAVYSASKAFVCMFSKALQAEYKGKGIIIQALTPLGVSTQMTNWVETNLFMKSAEDFARQSLECVTFGDETCGSLSHEFLAKIIKCIPEWIIHSDWLQETMLVRFTEKEKKNGKST